MGLKWIRNGVCCTAWFCGNEKHITCTYFTRYIVTRFVRDVYHFKTLNRLKFLYCTFGSSAYVLKRNILFPLRNKVWLNVVITPLPRTPNIPYSLDFDYLTNVRQSYRNHFDILLLIRICYYITNISTFALSFRISCLCY